MAVKQLSVFIQNHKGEMAGAVKKIADAGINIKAMSVAEAGDFGILRLITTNSEAAADVLKEDSLVKLTDVVAVKMEDIEGALYKVLDVLNKAEINVDYAYSFTANQNPAPYAVFRVDNVAEAEKVLVEGGCTLLEDKDLI